MALASIGIGGVKVDTLLTTAQCTIGDLLHGEVHVYGGNVEQTMRDVQLTLCTYVHDIDHDGEQLRRLRTLERVRMDTTLHVVPHGHSVVPFVLRIPITAPLSVGDTNMWVRTEAHMMQAIDPMDRDALHIAPHPAQHVVFDALRLLGCALHEVHMEPWQAEPHYRQTFVYIPGGAYKARMKELEVAFCVDASNMDVHVGIDRKTWDFGQFIAHIEGAQDKRDHRSFVLRCPLAPCVRVEDMVRMLHEQIVLRM
jgi:sporulation-control protein